MATKVTRAKRVANQRVRKSGSAPAKASTLAHAKRLRAPKPNPLVVHQNEAEEMVKDLNQSIDNVLTLAELADEHPYIEIALETLVSLRHMRDVIRLEMGSVLADQQAAQP